MVDLSTDSPSQFNQFSYHAGMFVLCQRSVEAISQYPNRSPQKDKSSIIRLGWWSRLNYMKQSRYGMFSWVTSEVTDRDVIGPHNVRVTHNLLPHFNIDLNFWTNNIFLCTYIIWLHLTVTFEWNASQNKIRSSSTPWNWRQMATHGHLDHFDVISTCYVYQTLYTRCCVNVILMIPHTNPGECCRQVWHSI